MCSWCVLAQNKPVRASASSVKASSVKASSVKMPSSAKCHICNKLGRRGWQRGFCRTHALQRNCRPFVAMQQTKIEELRNSKCKVCHKFARRGWQHGYCRVHALQEGYSPSSSPQRIEVEVTLKTNTSEAKQRITSKTSQWQIMAKMDRKQRRQEEAELEAELERTQAEVQRVEEHQTRILRKRALGLIITETHFDECTTLPEQQVTCSWYKGHFHQKEYDRECYCISS